MPDITKDKYDFAKVLKTDRDGARIDAVWINEETIFFTYF
jgi:predicted RNA-binding protein (virulence factor B family)